MLNAIERKSFLFLFTKNFITKKERKENNNKGKQTNKNLSSRLLNGFQKEKKNCVALWCVGLRIVHISRVRKRENTQGNFSQRKTFLLQ
jgi:hypothetical protein